MRWTPERLERAGEMVTLGHHMKDVGIVMGCSAAAVKRALSRVGVDAERGDRKIREVSRVVSFRMNAAAWESMKESASVRGKSVGVMLSEVAELMSDPVLLENVLDDGISI